jgi:hypothetical protein
MPAAISAPIIRELLQQVGGELARYVPRLGHLSNTSGPFAFALGRHARPPAWCE